ncbi:head-tail joining protein [Rickettsia endosymbiont of Cardiosporidium cionae]|uniref:head-tail joining protein n=1 Tax=Rickettsia endosymbiont of Cardiosporidium cionae TaxID=2777155 RepID=UPI001895C86E|nr:hypothetical protein [Rickettsia endosymbiont of Cardiosporidium cionae]KAF8818075.1 hypothetical protein IHI24_000874 [Rickettsia endosymbiont of Cardiosporidium cionae]
MKNIFFNMAIARMFSSFGIIVKFACADEEKEILCIFRTPERFLDYDNLSINIGDTTKTLDVQVAELKIVPQDGIFSIQDEQYRVLGEAQKIADDNVWRVPLERIDATI